jgi:microcystin-dependent protein
VPARGDYGGAGQGWDTPADKDLYTIDAALGGTLALSGLTGGTLALSAATLTSNGVPQTSYACYTLTGTLTSNQTITFPAAGASGGALGRKLILNGLAQSTFQLSILGNGGADTIGVFWPSGSNANGANLPITILVLPNRVFWDGYQDCPPGTIRDWYGTYTPPGWLPCIGQTINNPPYDLLVSVLGGTTTATIPDFRGRNTTGADVILGSASGGRLGTWVGSGRAAAIGEANHTLTIDQMPAHQHYDNTQGGVGSGHIHSGAVSSHTHDAGFISSGYYGVGNFAPYLLQPGSGSYATGAAAPSLTINATAITIGNAYNTSQGYAGTGQTNNYSAAANAHNTIPPGLTVNKIIRF